jgi:hypothetical protein
MVSGWFAAKVLGMVGGYDDCAAAGGMVDMARGGGVSEIFMLVFYPGA